MLKGQQGFLYGCTSAKAADTVNGYHPVAWYNNWQGIGPTGRPGGPGTFGRTGQLSQSLISDGLSIRYSGDMVPDPLLEIGTGIDKRRINRNWDI